MAHKKNKLIALTLAASFLEVGRLFQKHISHVPITCVVGDMMKNVPAAGSFLAPCFFEHTVEIMVEQGYATYVPEVKAYQLTPQGLATAQHVFDLSPKKNANNVGEAYASVDKVLTVPGLNSIVKALEKELDNHEAPDALDDLMQVVDLFFEGNVSSQAFMDKVKRKFNID